MPDTLFDLQAGFNQQIAQYRGKLPDQQLTDLAVGHFEDQLAKSQQQVGVACAVMVRA